MMPGKKDYRRWQYSDETEMSVEEQLTLEDHDHTDETPSTTFSQPIVAIHTARVHSKRSSKASACKAKVQVFAASAGLLLLGFICGYLIREKDQSPVPSKTPRPHSAWTPPSSLSWSTHEINESTFQKLVGQISADNIRHNLKRMSQEVHMAGTAEGRSMAMAIRDLWRSYGLSVRVEQHKALLTKTNAFNFVEVLDGNGSVLFTSSKLGDDLNIPNARPFFSFSPAADLNGTLIYGHFGSAQDFQYLAKTQVPLNGSIALIRFSHLHPSKVAATAVSFGVAGIVFYPDPADFGPSMPPSAIVRSSLLTLGQMHEYQKHKSKWTIPCHTISSSDAEYLFRLMMRSSRKIPKDWQGGLKMLYPLGGVQPAHLRIFNEPKSSSIYNVVAAIPGAWESDRYVIVGCSHDSWTYGAGDPGLGLALLTEIARVFATAVQKGWKTRRSILFVSWDANLYASSGVSHWLQEHHFEISSRAVAYIDLTRVLQGNQTLQVHSSPLLREVTRKAIVRVKRASSASQLLTKKDRPTVAPTPAASPIDFSSTVDSDEPSFAFLGNLGIPFIRATVANGPKAFNYPLFHTSFDTFDNFRRFVDPTFNGSETLGRIISGLILLLADSSLLPMNVEDYVEEIQKAFGSFMGHFHEDFHKANLSIAYLQAAVMRLEVIGDNFRTEMHNRSVIISNEHEHDHEQPIHQLKTKFVASRRLLFHRIINDKLMSLDRAFLSRKSDIFKHLVLGSTNYFLLPTYGHWANSSNSYNHHFPKLREAFLCGRKMTTPPPADPVLNRLWADEINDCHDWKSNAAQEVAALIRALDAAAAVLQSPLLPEESDSAST